MNFYSLPNKARAKADMNKLVRNRYKKKKKKKPSRFKAIMVTLSLPHACSESRAHSARDRYFFTALLTMKLIFTNENNGYLVTQCITAKCNNNAKCNTNRKCNRHKLTLNVIPTVNITKFNANVITYPTVNVTQLNAKCNKMSNLKCNTF